MKTSMTWLDLQLAFLSMLDIPSQHVLRHSMTNALHFLPFAAEVLGIRLLCYFLGALVTRAVLIPVRVVIEQARGLRILRTISESIQGGTTWAGDIPGAFLLLGTADQDRDRRGRKYTRS